MTAIVGIFGPGVPGPPDDGARGAEDAADAAADRMLARMAGRGSEWREGWRGPGALLAAAGHGWELAPSLGGGAAIARRGDLVAAADASVYYQADLLAALGVGGGAGADATGPAALLLRAYEAWGAGWVNRVDGDFAAVVWDARRRLILCARDFAGSRPLHHASCGDLFVVASTVGGVLGHPACPGALDPGRLAEQAFDLWGDGRRTAFAAVRALAPGAVVSAAPGASAREVARWTPPPFDERPPVPLADAADELRAALGRAVAERAAGEGDPTSVWLSGGWDSTALYATAQARAPAPGLVPAVSISYPPGNSGREDELITAVAQRWGGPVHWIDVAGLPMLDDLADRALAWDEPFAHPFERWNESLARATRACGARVALNGHGGDQLFAVSNAYLADLLAAGRWRELGREWQARRLGAFTVGKAWRWTVRPRLSDWAARVAAGLRGGRPLGHYLERPLPPWANARFAAEHRVNAAGGLSPGRVPGQTAAAFEAQWYLTNPYIAHLAEQVASRALAVGVSLRFPLYDRRVIALAATRPRRERAGGGETKLLLRRAMAGLLPPHVLAPRVRRTGTTTSYWRAAVRARGPALFAAAFDAPRLAELGIVDPEPLRAAAVSVVAGRADEYAAALLATLRAELWLRAGERSGVQAPVDLAPALTRP